MGQVYDQPRETLTAGAGRREPALPDHGRRRPDPLDPGLRLRARARLAAQHARLDDQQEALLGPGAADLRLRARAARSRSSAAARSCSERAVEGWEAFEGHTPHRPYVDAVRIACPSCGAAGRAHPGRRQPVAGRRASCRSRRSTTARTRTTGRSGSRPTSSPRASRASSATGSTRCSRCRTVLRGPSRSRRSSATPLVFGEDGRPMHKSWGNAIEFDEAAERMGVDVMRWMFAKARPEDNILFGWHAADEARRELLVLWNVYAFFVTYARLAGWTPGRGAGAAASPSGRSLDRWILSRAAGLAAAVEERLRDFDARRRDARAVGVHRRPVDLVPAPVAPPVLALGRRGRPGGGVRDAPRGARRDRADARADPAVPGRGDVRQPRRRRRPRRRPTASTSPRWPTSELAGHRDDGARGVDGQRRRRAVDLARTLRSTAPASRRASRWPRPGWRCPERGRRLRTTELLELVADEINVKARRASSATTRSSSSGGSSRSCRRSASGSARPSRRSWRRPASGDVEFHADGSVTLAGVDARRRRGRDPGDAATGHGRRPRRRPRGGPRHRADAGAARRGRRARAPARDPGPAQARPALDARRPDRAVGRRRCRTRSRRTCRPSPPTRSRTLATGRPPGGRRRARPSSSTAGAVAVALRRRAVGA